MRLSYAVAVVFFLSCALSCVLTDYWRHGESLITSGLIILFFAYLFKLFIKL